MAACGGATAEEVVEPSGSSTATSAATDSASTDEEAGEDTAEEAGEDAEAAADADESGFPIVVTDETGAEIEIESIERIIPLDGTVAEVVFALGLGDNVVATDLSATYPPEADALPEIGYQRALSAEPIAAFSPTVLIGTEIAGPPEVLDDLRRLGYPVVIVPNEATPEGPAAKVRAVADALGVSERGEALASELEAAIADSTAPADNDQPVVVALYLRGASTQLVLGEESATHWLIEAAGGIDAADELGVIDATPIAPEAILTVAPDVILVPSAGLESVGGMEGILDVGGLGETPAGRNGQIVAFDDQLLLGNGPRTGEVLAELRAALDEALVES
ncbi:MAG: ABC transporter substrate-binding protein [Actinomycetota bacterium]